MVAEIGLNKIALFPEKVKALKDAAKGKIDNSYPISVELSPTHLCNLNCIWCSDRQLKLRAPNASLKKEIMFKLFEDLKKGGTKGIVIEGGGEPTVHPDFVNLIKKLKELKMPIGLATNGVLYKYEDLLGAFQWIRISLDTSNADEFTRIKGINRFDQVLKNIKSMCDWKKKNKSEFPVIGIGYVVSNQNLSDIAGLVVKLKEMGVNYIHFRPVIDHPYLSVNIDLNHLKKYEDKNFSIMASAMEENRYGGNEGLPCFAHSLSVVITSEGDVHLCGRLNVYDWFEPIGNLNKQSFNEIWNGEKRKEKVNKVMDPEFCKKNCLQCRMTKFNKLILNPDIDLELSKISKEELAQVKTRDFI